METKYILVEWPESQYFMGIEGCYFIDSTDDDSLDQAMVVPEDIYSKITNGEN